MDSSKKPVAIALFLMIVIFPFSCSSSEDEVQRNEPVAVTKSNAMKVYMHYMPWYQSKEISGYWGNHWKMNTANPDNVDSNGKREIASHYYPLIGPYDSQDPDVIEYHLLLMKYAGVDALLMDWYGSHDVYDYKINDLGVSSTVSKLDEVGLDFALVYEDYTASNVEDQTNLTALAAAKADMSFLQTSYFKNEQYISIDGKPLLLIFGPRLFSTQEDWTEILSALPTQPQLLPLWNHGHLTGDHDTGEFSWVDFTSGNQDLINFYGRTTLEVMMGSAYPRFHDYYVEGGWGTSFGSVPANNGETFKGTLILAKERHVDHIQLVTWNDFGEGTVIEPTLEDQFTFLQILQEFTGVSYGVEELQLIHQYYLKKKKYAGNAEAQAKLKDAFELLTRLEVDQASQIISALQ